MRQKEWVRNTERKTMLFRSWTEEWIYMRVWVFACAAGWPSGHATRSLAFRLVATHSCPLSHRLSKYNQSLFLRLLLRGVWPFCMWPFLDFSLTSSPSSSDSVSSLSLRSSWTMSCRGKKKKKESLHRDCFHSRVEGKRAINSATPYVPWQEFDNHSQDEPCPEDLQDLKHTH